MGAQVLQLRRTHEVDVIARKTPGHRDLRDQVGSLFIDSHPNGTVYEVQFDPAYTKLQGAILDVERFEEDDEHLSVVDAEDGKRWVFEINDLDDIEDDEEEEE